MFMKLYYETLISFYIFSGKIIESLHKSGNSFFLIFLLHLHLQYFVLHLVKIQPVISEIRFAQM